MYGPDTRNGRRKPNILNFAGNAIFVLKNMQGLMAWLATRGNNMMVRREKGGQGGNILGIYHFFWVFSELSRSIDVLSGAETEHEINK